MDKPMVYLDHNATTLAAPEVLTDMAAFLNDAGYNPSSPYTPAQRVRAAVDRARQAVAALLDVDPEELVFTSGATESCNTIIQGFVRMHAPHTRIILPPTEHSAVRNCAAAMGDARVEVVSLPVDREGCICVEDLRAALVASAGRPTLVCLMLVNNETGVLQDVAAAAVVCREFDARLLCDATAAIGKLDVHPRRIGCDFLAASAHKFNGPKGAGFHYIRRGVNLLPLIHGGEQEDGRRGGTENVPGIIGMGCAAELARARPADHVPAKIMRLRRRLESAVQTLCPAAEIIGRNAPRACNTTSVRVPGMRNDELTLFMDRHNICISTGSACSTGAAVPSPVIQALGYRAREAAEVVRISLGHESTDADVDRFLEVFEQALAQMAAKART